MTTNQTIDGVLVSRELIDRVTKPLTIHDDLTDRIKARDELRALLDAAPHGWKPCSPELLESGVDCAAAPRWSAKEWDGHSHWHPAPAAQPQCEPVAWVDAPNSLDWYVKDLKPLPIGTKLYTEQPAPVAVVLPTQQDFERLIIRRDGSVNVSVLGNSRFYNDATIDSEYFVWLTCLDEVTRLNPSL